MTVLLTLLLLGVLDNKVPTDAEIAARIEAALRLHLSPQAAQVTVQRHSRFSTTLDSLEITLRGFTVDALPFDVAAPTAVPASTRPAVLGTTETLPSRATKPEKQVRIIKLRLRCEDFTMRGLAVQQLDMTLDEVRVPMAAVNEGRLAIAAADSATGTVTLHERALTQFIAARPLPINDPKVEVSPGGLRVTGGLKAFLNAPVEVRGALAARNGGMLYLDRPGIRVLKVPIPGVLTQRALRDLDPLTNLNVDLHLPAPVTISAVEHRQGTLRFTASLQLPKASTAR